jgi:hypothetical protein
MATKSTKPVTRESSAFVRDRGLRPIIVTISGSLIELRGKGLRRVEYLDIAAAFSLAVKQRVAAEKAEKKAKKHGR